VKLFQTLIVSTVLHGCACWTLSHTVCHKLNVFQSQCLRTTLGVRWQDHVYQMIQSTHDVKSPCHWLNLYGSEGWAGLDMFCVTMTSLSTIGTMFLFSRPNYRGCGRHGTLVSDLAGDVSLVCNLASEDSSLPLNRAEFNSSSSSFIRQAGRDLGCFKCTVSCAKPYISASWYQKHQQLPSAQ